MVTLENSSIWKQNSLTYRIQKLFFHKLLKQAPESTWRSLTNPLSLGLFNLSINLLTNLIRLLNHYFSQNILWRTRRYSLNHHTNIPQDAGTHTTCCRIEKFSLRNSAGEARSTVADLINSDLAEIVFLSVNIYWRNWRLLILGNSGIYFRLIQNYV